MQMLWATHHIPLHTTVQNLNLSIHMQFSVWSISFPTTTQLFKQLSTNQSCIKVRLSQILL